MFCLIAASANIRLRWNYHPDSDLFVIYTVGQQFASLVAANPAQFTQNRFAIKMDLFVRSVKADLTQSRYRETPSANWDKTEYR